MSSAIDIAPLSWLARYGAAAEQDVASALALASTRAAHRRLCALEAAGHVRQTRLLHEQPALWLATSAGLRLAGLSALGACSVSASSFRHMLECGHVAAVLEQGLDAAQSLCGERELRAWERAAGKPLASAEVGRAIDGTIALHRPDLVLWTPQGNAVAVEVELTCKAPQRLRSIVRGWARSRCVDSVVYLCSPDARRAVQRAVEIEWAHERVAVLTLEQWTPTQIQAKFVSGSNSSVPSRA